MKVNSLLVVAVLAIVGVGAYRFGLVQGAPKAGQVSQSSETGPAKTPLYWHDPMVPGQRFDRPGKSPFMDMALVPVYSEDGESHANTVSIDSRVEQNLGVRTAAVIEGRLESTLTAVGNVAYNERDLALVQARSTGFVEQVSVRTPFEAVKKGQQLATVYVPDWIAAQEEYLAVLKMNGSHLDGLVDAARQRMLLVGMSQTQINEVTKTARVQSRLAITAPIGGVVTELALREGMTINVGTTLFRINGLSSVWVNAEIPESRVAELRPGDLVEARVTALPERIFKGRVEALLAEVSPVTRTIKARIELVNAQGELVPGMFATVHLLSTRSSPPGLLVPSEAVIQTGSRSVILVEQGPGKFAPTDIETGRQAHGQTEIKKGLVLGQKVVVSGQFLIDSEASLKGTALRLTDRDSQASSAGASR